MHRPTTRTVAAIATLLLATALVGCSRTAAPNDTWTGTSTSPQATQDLRLEARRSGDLLRGSYYVGAARGEFDGTVDGTALTATLTPSADCTYALTGTITTATIDATFAPADCPDGGSGSWSLTRR